MQWEFFPVIADAALLMFALLALAVSPIRRVLWVVYGSPPLFKPDFRKAACDQAETGWEYMAFSNAPDTSFARYLCF